MDVWLRVRQPGLVWYKRSGHIIVLRQCANALHGILVKLLTEASTV
jgi:hypothetical protein